MGRFNIAVLTHCPDMFALKAAFEEFAGSERFVITDMDPQGSHMYATLNVDGDVTIQSFDRDKKAMDAQTVTKTKSYAFRIEPLEDGRGVLQVYAGSASIYKTFEAFFAECVADDAKMEAQEITVEPIELFERIFGRTKVKAKDKKGKEIEVVAEIKKAKFTNYEARGDVSGTFSASFKNSGEGREFIETFAANFKVITVQYGHKANKVRVSYGNKASFGITAGADVGDQSVRWLLEDLIKIPAGDAVQEEVQA
jgi:hypothetical protein